MLQIRHTLCIMHLVLSLKALVEALIATVNIIYIPMETDDTRSLGYKTFFYAQMN